LVKTPISKIFN
jgi:hypothetical protein